MQSRQRLLLCCLFTMLSLAVAGQPYQAIGKYEAAAQGGATHPVRADLQAQYQQAIADASQADWSEVERDLIALVPSSAGLVWENDGETTRVLLVTWTGWSGYNALAGATTTLTRDVWATAAPEVKNFISQSELTGAALTARLEQLIGLPPGNGATRFVEIWADPEDLFRPSADPEITDHEAMPEYPRPASRVTISPAHQQWISELTAASYGADGYPWTRLGYTYDWGNPHSKRGASEFIIRHGAGVKIHSVTLTDQYRDPSANGAKMWNRYE